MRNLFTLIFLMFSLVGKAQFNKSETAFLDWFLNEFRQRKESNFYLADQRNAEVNEFVKAIKPDTLVDMWAIAGRDKPSNKLILTKKEKAYIAKQLKQFKNQKLADHLLPNAELLSRDTVNYYMKDRIRGWSRMYDRGIRGFYTFGKPIFLRKGTFCIFQFDFNCGSLCGDGTIMVYRKEKGKWQPYLNLANWIS